MAYRFRMLAGAAALCLFISGCAVARSEPELPEEPQSQQIDPPDPNQLPASLEELALSAEQRLAIVALRDRLRRRFSPVESAGVSFLSAVARSARQCEGDSPFLAMEASSVISASEEFREPLLDGIDELHAILTPPQRQALVDRLLDQDRKRAPRDDEGKRKPRDNRQVKSLGERMDLSFFQMMKLLVRLNQVRDDFDDQVEPWRERYREAVPAFASPNFKARDQEVSRAPALRIVMGSLRKALRVAVPLLEPEQCQAMSDILSEQLDKREQTERERAASDEGSP